MNLQPKLFFFLCLTATALAGNGQLSGADSASRLPINTTLEIPPYLQSLSEQSVAIHWRTTQPSYGWVEYGETQALGLKGDTTVFGLKTANVKEQRVMLTGLRPGTTYYYRVCFKPIQSFGPYKVEFGTEEQTPITRLKTLPAANHPVIAVIYNDLHNNRETFRLLRRAIGEAPFDFTIFNGDCLADPQQQGNVLSTLADFTVNADAATWPAFFVRGNHETRGAFARELPQHFSWPGDKPYYAFSAGPVRFLVLDCGEDKDDTHPAYSGLGDFESFRRTETEWLKKELQSRAFRKATWRVLVHHIPLYPEANGETAFQPCLGLWGKLLTKAHIDLAINAHTHDRAFHPANTVGAPYPIAVGGGPNAKAASVMILEADSKRLKLQMLDSEGVAAFPTFEKKR